MLSTKKSSKKERKRIVSENLLFSIKGIKPKNMISSLTNPPFKKIRMTFWIKNGRNLKIP